MNNKLILFFFGCLLSVVPFSVASSPRNSEIRSRAEGLLVEWMDTFLTYQLIHPNAALDGGVMCPACARMHGRIGDAVLPLMYLADTKGDPKYLNAAKRLMKWMENVHRPDGSWMNDVQVSDWNGTTVFASIALYEALYHHGHLLDDSTRNHWKDQLVQAGEFMMKNPFIYSRRREGMRNMNVNYSASATYALYAVGTMCGRPDFVAEAKQIASDLRPFFTENEFFLFGEGPEIHRQTSNACFPIDLLYNVEESLPNLAYYARMSGDEELLALVEKSMRTHLEFMLPDGAWDNSWGTRSFKWTYWGGRTSDGFMGGYYALADRNPDFAEAIRRNLSLLQKATSKGLLLGGMHYEDCGAEPCIHHTFGHAKALASFLNLPVCKDLPTLLPRDTAYGVKRFKDIHTWTLAKGPWRATVTGYDAEYKVKGTHPMGGALSMVWHRQIGPVFAATMNRYTMIEAPNMQMSPDSLVACGTPRMEYVENGVMYSHLDDLNFQLNVVQESKNPCWEVQAHLVDFAQQYSSLGPEIVTLSYEFTERGLTVEGTVPQSMRNSGVRLVLPLIASPKEKVKLESHSLEIDKGSGSLIVRMRKGGELTVLPTNGNGRIFNPVPGFAFVPLAITPDRSGRLEVFIHFQPLK